MERLFYTVGDVAEILGESASAVRFWSNSFSRFLHPVRNGKGDRRFKKDDVETFKRIHYLLKTQGMTLEGASKAMLADKNSGVDKKLKVVESLRDIREQLEQIRKSL